MDTKQSNILYYREPHSVEHIMQLIHNCGFDNVNVTDNLQEVSQLLLTSDIDLIIITKLDDLKKTVEAFINYRENDGTTHKLPLVVITQNESITSMQKKMAQGVDLVLIEPVSQQLLQDSLSYLLSIAQDGIIGMGQLKIAQNLIEKNKPDEAVLILQDLLEFPDMGIEVSVCLCQAYIETNDLENANSTLKQLIKIAKATDNQVERNIRLSTASYLYGKLQLQKGFVDKALDQYRIAYDLHHYNVANLVELIKILPNENKVNELETLLQNTVSDFLPFSKPLEIIATPLSQVCEQLQNMGLETESHNLFNILLKIDHTNEKIYQQTLLYCVKKGKFSLLLEHAKYILAKVKKPELFYNLARSLLDIDSGKIKFFNKEAGKVKTRVEQDNELENKKTLLSLAKDAIQQVVFWEPKTPKNKVLLAIAEFRLGNIDTATSILQQVKQDYQNDLDKYSKVIRDLLDEKIYQVAYSWIESAEEYFPDNEIILKLKSDYFCSVGEPIKAVRAIKTYLLKDSNNVGLIMQLGEVYLKLKDRNNALVYFEKAKKIAPNDQNIISQLKAVNNNT